MPDTVRTANVTDRRRLQLTSIEDLRNEVDNVLAKPVRVTGNWSAAQILRHVGRLIEFSYDGFPMSAPWPIRLIGRLLRNRLLRGPMRPGFKLPAKANALIPDPNVTLEQAGAYMNAWLDRIQTGQPMTQPSPILGKLTNQQWIQLHLRHAEMHFSFIHYRNPTP